MTDQYAELVHETFGFEASAPYSGDAWDLITGLQIASGSRERIAKKKSVSQGGKTASVVYGRLMAAGQRLMALIKKSGGLANKDMAKFADQINSLCDKWEK